MKTNSWIWIALILLSASSFSVSGKGTMATVIILGAAGVKAGLVGWRFMELRTAHVAWKLAFPILLFGTVGLLCLLSRIS